PSSFSLWFSKVEESGFCCGDGSFSACFFDSFVSAPSTVFRSRANSCGDRLGLFFDCCESLIEFGMLYSHIFEQCSGFWIVLHDVSKIFRVLPHLLRVFRCFHTLLSEGFDESPDSRLCFGWFPT